MNTIDIIGWLGTLLVLGAFAWVTITKRADVLFQSANLFGAVLLGLNAWSHGAPALIGLNVAWFVISAVGLWNLRPRRYGHGGQWHATRKQRKAVLRELRKAAIDEHFAEHARQAWGQHLGWLPEGQGDLPTKYPAAHLDASEITAAWGRAGLPKESIAPATYATDLPKNFTSLEEI